MSICWGKSDMVIPDYLSYFFRENQQPFEVLTDRTEDVAEAILSGDTLWRGDGTYLAHRKRHEGMIRDLFIQKGGAPRRRHPIYAILGESPVGPHDLENEYAYKIRIPLNVFTEGDVSFTYPDSLFEVPIDDPGRLDLERSRTPVVYTAGELSEVIRTYRVYEFNNHYVEAQIWNDEPLAPFAGRPCWIRCVPR